MEAQTGPRLTENAPGRPLRWALALWSLQIVFAAAGAPGGGAWGAETLLDEKDFETAQTVFERVAKDSKSDQRTLAIAWSGLGDCHFQAGAKNPTSEASKASLQDALKAYMRVVVLFKGESNYVGRAMVYAGRIYTMMETEEAADNARKLFGAVIRQFPGSKWAQEARGFAKKR